MDTHRAKSKADRTAKRAKRQVEQWTDDTKTKVEDACLPEKPRSL